MDRSGRFDGRVAVVTGGASGIGWATAERLASEGATVLVLDRDVEQARTTVDARPGGDSRLRAIHLDLLDDASVVATAAQIGREHAEVHALVNCAGLIEIDGRPNSTFIDGGLNGWDPLFGVNVRGAAAFTHALLEPLIQGRAAIVNVSSEGAFRARPTRWVYDASKAAMISFTRSLAAGLAPHGVRVNAVAPGGTVTEMHLRGRSDTDDARAELRAVRAANLLGRFAEPPEIAAAIAFLCSDDASFVTATTLAVDGGGAASR